MLARQTFTFLGLLFALHGQVVLADSTTSSSSSSASSSRIASSPLTSSESAASSNTAFRSLGATPTRRAATTTASIYNDDEEHHGRELNVLLSTYEVVKNLFTHQDVPTMSPTKYPTRNPTVEPTPEPTKQERTDEPTMKPSASPTRQPTPATPAPTLPVLSMSSARGSFLFSALFVASSLAALAIFIGTGRSTDDIVNGARTIGKSRSGGSGSGDVLNDDNDRSAPLSPTSANGAANSAFASVKYHPILGKVQHQVFSAISIVKEKAETLREKANSATTAMRTPTKSSPTKQYDTDDDDSSKSSNGSASAGMPDSPFNISNISQESNNSANSHPMEGVIARKMEYKERLEYKEMV